jgi:hypothetical protein
MRPDDRVRIAEWQRRPEHALWREFELARPCILGALLDAAAHGLRMLPRVFDAGRKCLLGIMSRKISVNSADAASKEKDIAKYFVPASTIRAFIPTDYPF